MTWGRMLSPDLRSCDSFFRSPLSTHNSPFKQLRPASAARPKQVFLFLWQAGRRLSDKIRSGAGISAKSPPTLFSFLPLRQPGYRIPCGWLVFPACSAAGLRSSALRPSISRGLPLSARSGRCSSSTGPTALCGCRYPAKFSYSFIPHLLRSWRCPGPGAAHSVQ